MAAGWAAAVGAGLSTVGGALDLIYTPEERAEAELANRHVDLGYEQLETRERIAQQQRRAQLVGGAQATQRTETLVMGAAVVAALVVGGVVVLRAA